MYKMNFKQLTSAVFLSLFLTGCSIFDDMPAEKTNVRYIDKNDLTWQQNLNQIKKIKTYSATGQLGYISSKERFSTRFDWQYSNPKAYHLKLYSTISSSTLDIKMDKNGMTISDNDGNKRSEADEKMLLREVIGMDFPLDQFAFWLKGQPDESKDYAVGENHLLAKFSYPIDGSVWTATYLGFHEAPITKLPKDILLKNQDQTLKIRVDEWKY